MADLALEEVERGVEATTWVMEHLEALVEGECCGQEPEWKEFRDALLAARGNMRRAWSRLYTRRTR